MPPFGPYAWFPFLVCCERAIFWSALLARLIHHSSYSTLTWRFSPGARFSLYDGAKQFSSGRGWWNSLYRLSQTPLFAQFLLYRGRCPLSLTLPNLHPLLCGMTLLPSHLGFSPIRNSSSGFALSLKTLVCQPVTMPVTLSVGVGPPLPFGQVYQSTLSRYWVIGTQMLFSFILRFHCQSAFTQLIL